MVVMKFGGTSVADAKAYSRVINIIKQRKVNKTIVVVSAIAQATNILTKLANLAAQNKLVQCQKIIEKFKNQHLKIAQDLISHKKLLAQTQKQINYYFAELDTALKGTALIAELSDRNFAKIVAYGELLSSTILHAALLENNLKNTLIDARKIIITDDNYQKGEPQLEIMAKNSPKLINKHLNRGKIVVTQGFIASTKDGVTTILGREGSDYSASLIGMIMDAQEIQIWTDVDGVLTADPSKIKKPKFIPELSFQEAAELSYFGAKVIHPATISPAAQKNIPVRILNSMNLDPKQKGTLISSSCKTNQSKISSITYKEHTKIINISTKKKTTSSSFLQKVFLPFANQQIIIDAATISGASISLAINHNQKIDKIIDQLKSFAQVSVEDNWSLIGIIGRNLRGIEKITKKVLKILDGHQLEMLIHGSSNHNLILIVPRKNLFKIVERLHDAVF